MPRKRVHRPLSPAQEQTVHLLEWPGLWDGKSVKPEVETSVVIEGVRFVLDPETGKVKDVEGDEAKAKPAVDLLKHNDLT